VRRRARKPTVLRTLALIVALTVGSAAIAQQRDVSRESVAAAGEPLEVRWHADSFIQVPLRQLHK
jgi:hypothetical protein